MLAYYPDRSSPLLVKIGSRGITGAAAIVLVIVYGYEPELDRAVVIYGYDGRWALGIAGGSVA